jgi:CelD/BcsL family acetyltransferase involved in cellulose biosynthesis
MTVLVDRAGNSQLNSRTSHQDEVFTGFQAVTVLESLAIAKEKLLVGFLAGTRSGDLLVAALKRISLITFFICLDATSAF